MPEEQKLTVLYVEDDQLMRETLAARLALRFDKVYACENAEEALTIFNNRHLDIILTDYMLPYMSGLDMVARIRDKNWDIPIILITGYADSDFLMQAINLSVTQFVPKPVNLKLLTNALDIAIQRVALENLKRKNQEQELELLKYREKYHSTQQELAFHKELNALRNDFDKKVLDVVNKYGSAERWTIDMAYRGLDIMSGDTYSVHKIGDDKLFCFILDAMGKGVGASVTSMVSATYINHIVEQKRNQEHFPFKEIITQFIGYIQRVLLDEEIICGTFLFIDFFEETLTYSSFSMPKIWVNTIDGAMRNYKSNNLPIMKHTKDFEVDTVSVNDIRKLLVSSDGLTEATVNNTVYEQYLAEDFKQSGLLSSFMLNFQAKQAVIKDDTTIFYLQRSNTASSFEYSFAAESRLSNLTKLEQQFTDILTNLNIDNQESIQLVIAFNEAVMNAFEHGNFGIQLMDKHRAVNDDIYDELITEREKLYGYKKISCYVSHLEDKYRVIRVRVIDEGNGYNIDDNKDLSGKSAHLLCGRGLELIKMNVDHIYYSAKGNEIVIIKILHGGNNGYKGE